jgi:hypothetical protein
MSTPKRREGQCVDVPVRWVTIDEFRLMSPEEQAKYDGVVCIMPTMVKPVNNNFLDLYGVTFVN